MGISREIRSRMGLNPLALERSDLARGQLIDRGNCH
jgi:hypothetical protein